MKPKQGLAGTFAAAMLAVTTAAQAQAPTPVGLWKTFNERGGQAEGLVRIVERDGELLGTVAVFSPPAPDPNPRCEDCRGALKNQPVVGMTILRGLRWDGERYSGGEILDPDDGVTYRCQVRVVDEGRKLEVRGYVGLSLFGRTQVWAREPAGS